MAFFKDKPITHFGIWHDDGGHQLNADAFIRGNIPTYGKTAAVILEWIAIRDVVVDSLGNDEAVVVVKTTDGIWHEVTDQTALNDG